jgi:hypothetical protein
MGASLGPVGSGCKRRLDGRDEPGHDGGTVGYGSLTRGSRADGEDTFPQWPLAAAVTVFVRSVYGRIVLLGMALRPTSIGSGLRGVARGAMAGRRRIWWRWRGRESG